MCKTNCGSRYAEKLEYESSYLLLFNSVISGLYIKEATKVICAGSDPALLGAELLRKRRGEMSIFLRAGTVCGLNISVCSLCIICMDVDTVIENKNTI